MARWRRKRVIPARPERWETFSLVARDYLGGASSPLQAGWCPAMRPNTLAGFAAKVSPSWTVAYTSSMLHHGAGYR